LTTPIPDRDNLRIKGRREATPKQGVFKVWIAKVPRTKLKRWGAKPATELADGILQGPPNGTASHYDTEASVYDRESVENLGIRRRVLVSGVGENLARRGRKDTVN